MKAKTKRTITLALAFIVLFLMMGIIGGMELQTISLGKGCLLAGLCEAVGKFLLWKAGVVRVW